MVEVKRLPTIGSIMRWGRTDMSGQTYLVRMGDTDYYKVGKGSLPSVRDRISSLQTGNPINLQLVSCYEQKDPYGVEVAIHTALNEYHVRGDWFKCDHDTILKIFTNYNTMAVIDTALDDPTDDSVPVHESENAQFAPMCTGTVRYGTIGTNGVETPDTAVRQAAVSESEIAIAIKLLSSGMTPSTVTKKLPGYDPRRYQESRSKVDYVINLLDSTTRTLSL